MCLCVCACGRPFLANDGTLVIPQTGAHGAAVVTANGFEFHDVSDVPARIVVRDPYEPWRAPVGFLVPASGRFVKTSTPTFVGTAGLAVWLRPSDTRVPSWGGEMLVRVDVVAPAAQGTARWGEDIGIVIDGRGEDTRALCEAAVAQLGERDRVVVVDTSSARVVVPTMPAANRSLIVAAVAHRLASPARASRDRVGAVAAAVRALSGGSMRRLLVLSDSGEEAQVDAGQGIGQDPVPLTVVATTGGGASLDERVRAVKEFIPPAGDPAFSDVVLAFDGTPSPAHVLEASGGDARWELEGGELALGTLRRGDERTEMVRVTIPAWTPGEPFTLHVTARFGDLSRGGERRTMSADLGCLYDENIERLAESRNGDVIAYASALATLARLDAAFIGGAGAHGDVRRLARMHARSLALLARDLHDVSAAAQAALLEALLEATD
jgi:hypothetical protein